MFLSERPWGNFTLPGLDLTEIKHVGQLPLEGGGCVFIGHHTCSTMEQAFPSKSVPCYFKGKGEEQLLAHANRAVGWGPMPDGSIIFQEAPVIITKDETS